MKRLNQIFLQLPLLLFLLLAGCKGCDSVTGEDYYNPLDHLEGDECLTSCYDGAYCDNGYCECNDPELELAPGFCANNRWSNTWVTYDVTPFSDTSLLAFPGINFITLDNFEGRDWIAVGGGKEVQNFAAYHYTQGARTTINRAGHAQRERVDGVVSDRVWLDGIYKGYTDTYYRDPTTPCFARILFRGVIVDDRTLSGEVYLNGIVSCDGEVPARLRESYPMTWHRIN